MKITIRNIEKQTSLNVITTPNVNPIPQENECIYTANGVPQPQHSTIEGLWFNHVRFNLVVPGHRCMLHIICTIRSVLSKSKTIFSGAKRQWKRGFNYHQARTPFNCICVPLVIFDKKLSTEVLFLRSPMKELYIYSDVTSVSNTSYCNSNRDASVWFWTSIWSLQSLL